MDRHYASVADTSSKQDKAVFKGIKRLLTRILPGDVDSNAIQVRPRDSLGWGGESGVYLDTFSGRVPWSELSLGYQTTLAWTADFAWRLLKYYSNSEDPFSEPAVVLIDEIDLHLHPRWQLGIMKDLSLVFPRTQFVATSHSPLMAQVAENANFVLLRKREREGNVEIINEPAVVHGWRVDQILTSDLFGGLSERSPEVETLFIRRDELFANRSRNQAEDAELERLRLAIRELPTAQFPNDQSAMDSIREAAALPRKSRPDKE